MGGRQTSGSPRVLKRAYRTLLTYSLSGRVGHGHKGEAAKKKGGGHRRWQQQPKPTLSFCSSSCAGSAARALALSAKLSLSPCLSPAEKAIRPDPVPSAVTADRTRPLCPAVCPSCPSLWLLLPQLSPPGQTLVFPGRLSMLPTPLKQRVCFVVPPKAGSCVTLTARLRGPCSHPCRVTTHSEMQATAQSRGLPFVDAWAAPRLCVLRVHASAWESLPRKALPAGRDCESQRIMVCMYVCGVCGVCGLGLPLLLCEVKRRRGKMTRKRRRLGHTTVTTRAK